MLNPALAHLLIQAPFDIRRGAILAYLKSEIGISSSLVDILPYKESDYYFILSVYRVKTGRVAFMGVFDVPTKFKSYVNKKLNEYKDIVKPTLFSSISKPDDVYKSLIQTNLTESNLELLCLDSISLAAFVLKNISSVPESNLIIIQSYLDKLQNLTRVSVTKK